MELSNRDDLEREFAAKLGHLWAGQRRELTRMLGDPPDIDRIPPEWWEKCKRENDAALALLLYIVLTHSADQHLALIHRNDRVFSRLANADRTAQYLRQLEPQLADAAREEARRLADKIEARNRDAIAKAAEEESLSTRGEVKELTSRLFGESPVVRQAVTGTTWGRAVGGERVIARTVGLSPHDQWLTVYGSGDIDRRVCPVCEYLNATDRRTWSRFFPFGPPAHDRCRCEIVWAVELRQKAEGASPVAVS